MFYLVVALAVFLSIVVLAEGILYLLRWYEISNRTGDRDTTWVKAIWSNKARPLRTFVKECFYSIIYIATLCFGVITRFGCKAGLNCKPEQIDKDKPVVVLIHGYMSSPVLFWLMRWRLKRKSISNVITFGYKSIGGESIGKYAEQLRDFMLALRAETGVKHTVLIGHSLGGLIAHQYAATQAGEGEIKAVVALAAPFHGSRLAVMAITPMGRKLRPSNPLFGEIVHTGLNAPFLSIYSRYDQLVLPYTNSDHPLADKNVEVDGCGHSGFYFNGKVFKITAEWVKGVIEAEVEMAPVERKTEVKAS